LRGAGGSSARFFEFFADVGELVDFFVEIAEESLPPIERVRKFFRRELREGFAEARSSRGVARPKVIGW